MLPRRWALLVLGVTVIATSVAVLLHIPRAQGHPGPEKAPDSPRLQDAPATSETPTPSPDVTYPEVGSRTYRIAPADSGVTGRTGELLRYQVALETAIGGIDLDAFAAIVKDTYADPQGWTAGGQWRFQRVGPGQAADFVLYLVTPATRDALCEDGYDRYTSCRKDNRVVLNVARWVHGIPNYGTPLAAYQQYMINHETGHRLGFGHELCPGQGALAPVMEQQTLGLHGCLPNSWPFPGGRSYHGVSGAYAS
jgi:hypothetical protein